MASETSSQGQSSALGETQIPSTPIQASATLPAPKDDEVLARTSSFSSPPPRSSSADMTPPPSSQPGNGRSPPVATRTLSHSYYPASPPATVKVNSTVAVPSSEEISTASEPELRSMVSELVGAVREARMSAAHFKLQHSLLAMETHESAQRAEVEHEMTRREIEVLRADSRSRQTSVQPRPQVAPSVATEPILARCRDLELELTVLDRRLGRAKRLIEDERDRADLIQEENLLLKRRIRENRDHYTKMKLSSPGFSSPRTQFMTPQRRTVARYPNTGETQTSAFDALLAAGQVMNGEPISVPSTPTKTPASKLRHGHTRGAHSMSSLNSTPGRHELFNLTKQKPSQLGFPSVPSSQQQQERSRHDRDSTISVSGSEHGDEVITDEELPQSQASSLATSMLRRNPGPFQSQDSAVPQGTAASAEKQSNLLQAKLFGQVKKMIDPEKEVREKRKASFSDENMDMQERKRRAKEGVGLGIEGNWGSHAS